MQHAAAGWADGPANLLADGEYKLVARLTNASRFNASELQQMVESAGLTLVDLPTDLPDDPGTVVTEVPDTEAPDLAVEVHLWTKQHGRSDLVLRQRLRQVRPDGRENPLAGHGRHCYFSAAVRENEEVVPVNAVSTWVLPSGVTVGR